MKRTKIRGIGAALLIAALALTGCTWKLPIDGSPWGSSAPTEQESQISEGQPSDSGKTPEASMSEEASASLAYLRDAMEGTPLLFAVAYLGNAAQPEAHTAQWIQEFNPGIAEEYPFITEIPAERMIGDSGELYCIVPRNPQASLAINRLDGTGKSSGEEVLYRSEAGAPVLLFCNGAGQSGAELTLVSGDEQVIWQPGLDELEFISLPVRENGEVLAMDFTGYAEPPTGLALMKLMGWQPPTAEELGGTTWNTWSYPEDDMRVVYVLELRGGEASEFGDYDGEASLVWFFDGEGTYQETYEGWWRIEEADGQSCLRLDLLLNGGALFQENAKHISDLFPMLWDAEGENLALCKGVQSGTLLPFHNEQLELEVLTRSFG